jgi:hypothetical protein
MTASTLTLTPGAHAPGAGACADTTTHTHAPLVHPVGLPFGPAEPTAAAAFARVTRPGYEDWLDHVTSAGGCTRPIRLRGISHVVDTTTGEVRSSRSTADMPDGVVYKACGNRRASVCPSCADTYRADTYHLVLAGLVGGKTVPDTVSRHVAAFVTFTAPSFGLVHSRWAKKGQPAKVCRPRRHPQICPHGVDLRCFHKHHENERALGQPLCLDCYDHTGQVVWNVMAGELWRRTTDKIKTALDTWAETHGTKVRVSYAKVAELQARGVAHFHALIRLDGIDPDNPEHVVAPCEHATHALLEHVITRAVQSTTFHSLPHPDNRHGWPIGWGEQLDFRPVRLAADGAVTETQVAGYLAKYATKSTEDAGHTSARITPDTIRCYTAPDTHVSRLIRACWRLGRRGCDLDPTQAAKNSGRFSYRRLRRWAHMLGFGGHFSTKSRRYSTTLRALREARTTWRREHHRTTEHLEAEPETTLIVANFAYADTGWHTTGDALLANTAAAKAREHRAVARQEYAELEALDLI